MMKQVIFVLCSVIIVVTEGSTSWRQGARLLFNTYLQCENDKSTLWPCVKSRAIIFLDRASNMNSIPLISGLSIDKDLSMKNIQVIDNFASRGHDIDDLLWKKIGAFLQTHSIRLKLPAQLANEGRGKLKKMSGALLVAMMFKGMTAAIAVGALMLLAGKALLVSKLAMTLSLILTLKKLLSGGGSHHETYEIVAKHPSHHHDGSSSNHVNSVSEPGPGYFGHRRRSLRTITSSSTTPRINHHEISTKPPSSMPAFDYKTNVYTTDDFAQIQAYRGQRNTQH